MNTPLDFSGLPARKNVVTEIRRPGEFVMLFLPWSWEALRAIAAFIIGRSGFDCVELVLVKLSSIV